jgi:hypothetical protein
MRIRNRCLLGASTVVTVLALWPAQTMAAGWKSGSCTKRNPCSAVTTTTTTTPPATTTTTAPPATTTTTTEPPATTTTSTTTSPATTATTATTAPDTQGTWVSPEGLTIDIASAGPWTIRQVYGLVLDSSAGPGDFARVAPTLTIKVQDSRASQTVTSVSSSGGVYSNFRAVVYLMGVNSTFASRPDYIAAHEYGHAWTHFHLYLSNGGDWTSYLQERWANADGSIRLAGDSRLDSAYSWTKSEIIAEDYRLLFGSPNAISQKNSHLNSTIPDPRSVPGLRDFLLQQFAR